MRDCLFCQIAAKIAPTILTYEDASVVAFADLHPQAPVHQLIIPKKHIATMNDIVPQEEALIGHLYTVAALLAKKNACAATGYRVVMNCNEQGGQAIYHLHLHLFGGKQLHWPPGC